MHKSEAEKLRNAEVTAYGKIQNLAIRRREIEALAAAANATDAEARHFDEMARELANIAMAEQLAALAVDGIRGARVIAIAAAKKSMATELSLEAAKLRQDGESLYRQCDGLLGKLSTLQGVPYRRGILASQQAGSTFRCASIPESVAVSELGAHEMLADFGTTYAQPKSRQLINRAVTLETRARGLQHEPIMVDGVISAASLDELIANATSDPLRMQPRIAEIESWVTACDRQLYQSSPALMEAPRTYHLSWRAGKISADDWGCFLQVNGSKFYPDHAQLRRPPNPSSVMPPKEPRYRDPWNQADNPKAVTGA